MKHTQADEEIQRQSYEWFLNASQCVWFFLPHRCFAVYQVHKGETPNWWPLSQTCDSLIGGKESDTSQEHNESMTLSNDRHN